MDLKQLIDAIISSTRLTTDKSQLVFENTIPNGIIIKSDRMYLNSLFLNLIDNAVKYTNSDGIIKVNAEVKIDEVVISVKDNGIGIKQADLEKIFTEFFKVDPSRHERESFGLGLSIAKKITEKLNWRIWACSEGPGLGSTFYVAIPKDIN